LPAAQRKKVEARAAHVIAEEMTLQELRHARKLMFPLPPLPKTRDDVRDSKGAGFRAYKPRSRVSRFRSITRGHLTQRG
jgi:hypothetical protein